MFDVCQHSSVIICDVLLPPHGQNKTRDRKPIPDHNVGLRKETGAELSDDMWMAHLHDDVALPVEHGGKGRTLAGGEKQEGALETGRKRRARHLLAKAERSVRMSSSGSEPLSLSMSLFQTNPRLKPTAGPSSSILATRNWPTADAGTQRSFCYLSFDAHKGLLSRPKGQWLPPKCPYPTIPIF